MNKLYVPQKLKVGFNSRGDCYTGKLGFVIFHDGKEYRQELAWKNWIDETIDSINLDNNPMSGFVLNKTVGGYATDFGGYRDSYLRVYDPRGFEFEISIYNLLYIINNNGLSKGGELIGEYIFAWADNGGSIVLLPVDSEDYKSCLKHTQYIAKKVSKRTMKSRNLYTDKNGDQYVYLCDVKWFENNEEPLNKKEHRWDRTHVRVKQVQRTRLLFLNVTDDSYQKGSTIELSGIQNLKEDLGPYQGDVEFDIDSKIADCIKSQHGEYKGNIELRDITKTDIKKGCELYKAIGENVYTQYSLSKSFRKWGLDWKQLNSQQRATYTFVDDHFDIKYIAKYERSRKDATEFQTYDTIDDILESGLKVGEIQYDESVILIKKR